MQEEERKYDMCPYLAVKKRKPLESWDSCPNFLNSWKISSPHTVKTDNFLEIILYIFPGSVFFSQYPH